MPQLPHHAPQHQAGGQGGGKAVIQRDGRLGKGGVEEAALPDSGQGQHHHRAAPSQLLQGEGGERRRALQPLQAVEEQGVAVLPQRARQVELPPVAAKYAKHCHRISPSFPFIPIVWGTGKKVKPPLWAGLGATWWHLRATWQVCPCAGEGWPLY